MKYIEELNVGETFVLDNELYILTADFKANGNRCCITLKDGLPRWLSSQAVVEISPIYILDKDNNIISVRQTPKHESI